MYVFSWNPIVASELAIPHFLEEIHRPTMVAPVGDPDDPASSQQNTQKQHIVGISGMYYNVYFKTYTVCHST